MFTSIYGVLIMFIFLNQTKIFCRNIKTNEITFPKMMNDGDSCSKLFTPYFIKGTRRFGKIRALGKYKRGKLAIGDDAVVKNQNEQLVSNNLDDEALSKENHSVINDGKNLLGVFSKVTERQQLLNQYNKFQDYPIYQIKTPTLNPDLAIHSRFWMKKNDKAIEHYLKQQNQLKNLKTEIEKEQRQREKQASLLKTLPQSYFFWPQKLPKFKKDKTDLKKLPQQFKKLQLNNYNVQQLKNKSTTEADNYGSTTTPVFPTILKDNYQDIIDVLQKQILHQKIFLLKQQQQIQKNLLNQMLTTPYPIIKFIPTIKDDHKPSLEQLELIQQIFKPGLEKNTDLIYSTVAQLPITFSPNFYDSNTKSEEFVDNIFLNTLRTIKQNTYKENLKIQTLNFEFLNKETTTEFFPTPRPLNFPINMTLPTLSPAQLEQILQAIIINKSAIKYNNNNDEFNPLACIISDPKLASQMVKSLRKMDMTVLNYPPRVHYDVYNNITELLNQTKGKNSLNQKNNKFRNYYNFLSNYSLNKLRYKRFL